jgi:hypothetical protein
VNVEVDPIDGMDEMVSPFSRLAAREGLDETAC